MSAPAGRARTAFLLLLLVFAFALRLWYASYHFGPDRFYDERFAFENVHGRLVDGWLAPPRNGYYPTLAYLPQTLVLGAVDALHRATGEPRLAIYTIPDPAGLAPGRDRVAGALTPLAYRLARFLQVLWGTAALWVLYRLGRRLFDPEVGLLAAAILAASPWHVHSSAVFKPDALLLLTVLLALWASVVAILEPPSAKRYALAGLAIAAAASSKLTGVLVALPLAAATLVAASPLAAARSGEASPDDGRGRRRRLLYLVYAGAASALVYFLLNPHFRIYLNYLDRLTAEYEGTAAGYGGSRPLVLFETLRLIVDWKGLGVVFGTLAFTGVAALVYRLAGSARRPDGVFLARATIVVYPVIHTVAYAWQTPHFKANNLLTVLPPAALWAAWAACGLGRRLRDRLPRSLRPPATVAAVAAVVWLAVAPPWRYVYRSVVPTTTELVRAEIYQRFTTHRLRQIYVELPASPLPPWEGERFHRPSQLLYFPASRIDRVPGPARHRADVLVFPASVLERDERLADRWSRLAERNRLLVEPRLFHYRGPTMALVFQPLRPVGEPEVLPVVERGDVAPYCVAALPEDLEPGSVVSFDLWRAALPHEPPPASYGLHPLLAAPVENHRFHTERHLHRGDERILRIEPTWKLETCDGFSVALYRWRRGQIGRGGSTGD